MNQEQREFAAARDLTLHSESSRMDLPSRVEWFNFSAVRIQEPGSPNPVGTMAFWFRTQDLRAINKLSCPRSMKGVDVDQAVRKRR